MQTIKTMLRSPRFVVGLILFLAVICYAVFYPMVNTANPKADRDENPYYAETTTLRTAITEQNDEVIYSELERLEGSITDEETLAVLAEVRTAMDAGGLTDAQSAIKQLGRKMPVRDEFDTLKGYLGLNEGTAADIDAAKAEIERLEKHQANVVEVCGLISAGSIDDATAKITEYGLESDFSVVTDSLTAGDTAAATTAAETILDEHGTEDKKTDAYYWLSEIKARLDQGGYGPAGDAIKGIQASILRKNDQYPSKEHILGTDNFSRDILLEMAYGARLSLQVGLMAGCIATLIGICIGLLAGYCGGMIDNILSTITNIFIVIPSIVVLILISVALGQMKDAWVTGLIIGLTAWPWTARAVRAQTTSLRNRDHVNMARITGYGTFRIILTEILPYVASYVVMAFILQVASGITSEATLAILGLGDPTAISLGRMINWAMQYEAVRNGRWWEFVPVALCIACITYGLYLMNSGMDQVFNPKIRS